MKQSFPVQRTTCNWRCGVFITIAALSMMLVGCTNPLLRLAEQQQLHTSVLRGEGFLHQIISNRRVDAAGPLHVYLDGDGRPWRTPTQVSADPSNRDPLLLELLLQDQAPAVYVGRPCYFSLADDNCSAIWWTMQRYATQVVESIDSVIDQMAQADQQVVLIGYSGGGTLAMLIAQRRDDVKAVLTFAANLDTEQWSDYHNYTPLSGSLNPATQPPLPATIDQFHLFGGKDSNTPRHLSQRTLVQQTNSVVRVYPDFDHSCCWTAIWPEILKLVED